MDQSNQRITAYYSIILKGFAAQIKKAVDLLDDVIDDQDCFSEYLVECRRKFCAEKGEAGAGGKIRSKYVDKRYSWDKYVDDDEDDDDEVPLKRVEKRYSWDRYVYDDEDDDGEDLEEDYIEAFNNSKQVVEEQCFEIVETYSCVWIEDISQLANDLAYVVPEISFSISGFIEDSTEGVEDMMNFEIEYRDKKLTIRKTCWYICVYMDEFTGYNAFAKKFLDRCGKPRYTEEDYFGFLDCADEWYVLDSGQGEFSTDVPFEEPVRLKVKKPKSVY